MTTAARPLKRELLAALGARSRDDLELIDLGGDGSDPGDDYPDFACAWGGPSRTVGRSRRS